MDASVLVQRTRLFSASGESHFRDGHRDRWDRGLAGGRLAGRLSVAADERRLLPGFRRQHAAGGSGDDCGAVRERKYHAARDRVGSFLSLAEHSTAERGSHQFGWGPHPRDRDFGKHPRDSLSRRRAFAHDDGMGGRQAVAAI